MLCPVAQTGRAVRDPNPATPMHGPASVDCEIPSTHRTRILHVVDSLDVGGTETQMVQLAQRLDPCRYDVTVATLRAGGPLTEALQKAGIRILEFPKRRTMLSFQAAGQLIRMAWFIRRQKIDVVHAHDLWGNLMAVPAAWLARAPVIISSQRNLATLWWYTPRRKKIIRRVHLLATFVIANSDASRRLLIEEFWIPSERVRVLHNGVDFERIATVHGNRRELFPGLASNAKLIINVANMNSNVKGQSVLIEAAMDVCTALPESKFVLVGDGPLRAQFEEQVRKLGIWDHFLFLGRRRDVPEILSCGDLFVFPSFAEGLPNAVLEAAAAGLPIVATTVGGIPEIIEHGVAGLLVPPKNPQALCAALLQLLKDPPFAATLARTGKERVSSQFCFDTAVARLEALYDRTTS
jgi:glycosyltransferase involved in cell wall biosynthesis